MLIKQPIHDPNARRKEARNKQSNIRIVELPKKYPTMMSTLVSPFERESFQNCQSNLQDPMKLDNELLTSMFNIDYICPVEIQNGVITPSLVKNREPFVFNSSEAVIVNLETAIPMDDSQFEMHSQNMSYKFVDNDIRIYEDLTPLEILPQQIPRTYTSMSSISPFTPETHEIQKLPESVEKVSKREEEIRIIARKLSLESCDPLPTLNNYNSSVGKCLMDYSEIDIANFNTPSLSLSYPETSTNFGTQNSRDIHNNHNSSKLDVQSKHLSYSGKYDYPNIPLTVNEADLPENNEIQPIHELSLSSTISNIEELKSSVNYDHQNFDWVPMESTPQLVKDHLTSSSNNFEHLEYVSIPSPTSSLHSDDSYSSSFSQSSCNSFLPATIPSSSPPTSPELPYECLPESLKNLNLTPKATCTRQRTTNKRKRGPKLWEFLLDLLDSKEYNPSIIRWENKSEGIFRLIEQDTIASMWGSRRNKTNLSYDYFARALRYHYISKKLLSVPERKLVYKFGPKVMTLISN